MIAATLYNTHRYYGQFQPTVQKAITDSLAELEKQLEVGPCLLTYATTTTFVIDL